jgi:transglutaminase-like putative cysteine protease
MIPTGADDLQVYLQPTQFIDSDSSEIIEYARDVVGDAIKDINKAIKLYYAVRDGITYDPYRIDFHPTALKASVVLAKGYGFCISKAVLLAALARAEGIPSRLGFADVKNHLATERFRKLMQTDIFVYHGYTELFLEKRWVKATPAFNRSLCDRFEVSPLEFDGRNDSVFHEFDCKGNRHMEYVRDRGQFADLPYDQMLEVIRKHHPALFSERSTVIGGNFEQEAQAEKKK